MLTLAAFATTQAFAQAGGDALETFGALVEKAIADELTEEEAHQLVLLAYDSYSSGSLDISLEESLDNSRSALHHLSPTKVEALTFELSKRLKVASTAERSLEFCEALAPALDEVIPLEWEILDFHLQIAERQKDMRRWDAALASLTRCEESLDREGQTYRDHVLRSVYNKRAAIYIHLGQVDLASRWFALEREEVDRGDQGKRTYRSQRACHLTEANLLLARSAFLRLDELVDEWLENTTLYEPRSEYSGQLLNRQGQARLDRARTESQMIGPATESFEAADECELARFERVKARTCLAELAVLRGEVDEARERLSRIDSEWQRGDMPTHQRRAIETLRAWIAVQSGSPLEREQALRSLEQEFDEFLEDWKRMPPRKSGIGLLSFISNRRMIGELCKLAMLLDPSPAGVEQAFGYALRHQAMNSLHVALSGSDVTPSLADLREALCAPGHGFLVYLPAPTDSLLFLLDDQRLDHVELLATDHLSGLADALARHSNSGGEDLDAVLRAASDAYLPPEALAALARWTHVTIVGSDLFRGESFEELPTASGRTLVEDCAVGYSGSLPLLWSLAQRDVAARSEVWWLANPTPQEFLRAEFGDLPDLPLSELAADELFEEFDAGLVHGCFGSAARESALREPNLRHAALLHIVGHGIEDGERELPAGLVLHGDDLESALLRCEEVAELIEAPPLVLLSACGADRGPSRRGDQEITSFSGAFMLAGAGCVVLSPRRVEFHRTRAAMEVVHRELARGAAPSEALRRARLELPGRFPRLRAVGLAHRAVLPKPPGGGPNPLLLPLAILCGTAIAGYVLVRARTQRNS